MADTLKQEIKLFYCYAREDRPLRDELEKHLSWLMRRYRLTNWHDREILPGEAWEEAIDEHLNAAHLILLLISSDFMASDYCYGKEMQRALERNKAGTCRVLPILLRPTFWEGAPFSHLHLLPTGAKPITLWQNRDEAFQDVVVEVNRTIQNLLDWLEAKEKQLNVTKEQLEGLIARDKLELYEEALDTYKKAIELDPNNAIVYHNMANVLRDLKHPQEALAAYERAIELDLTFASAYVGKGVSLEDLGRYEEALAAYEKAIELDPNNALAYTGKANMLKALKRNKEAIAAYEQAVRLDSSYPSTYFNMGNTLRDFKRPREALAAYEQVIQLDPGHVGAYIGRGTALEDLRRYEEALASYEQAIKLDPHNAHAYTGKGNMLRMLNRFKEASQAFEKARQVG